MSKSQGQLIMERRQRERLRPKLRIKRWELEIEIKEPGQTEFKKLLGRISLTDFGPKGACVFTNFLAILGSEIQFTFPEPEPITFKGKIIYCHEHNLNQKVLTSVNFKYRIGIELKYDNEEERKKIEKLYLKAAHASLFKKIQAA